MLVFNYLSLCATPPVSSRLEQTIWIFFGLFFDPDAHSAATGCQQLMLIAASMSVRLRFFPLLSPQTVKMLTQNFSDIQILSFICETSLKIWTFLLLRLELIWMEREMYFLDATQHIKMWRRMFFSGPPASRSVMLGRPLVVAHLYIIAEFIKRSHSF